MTLNVVATDIQTTFLEHMPFAEKRFWTTTPFSPFVSL